MFTLELSFVRSHLPAVFEPSLEGQAFFDNAGGSYACQPSITSIGSTARTKCNPKARTLPPNAVVKRWTSLKPKWRRI
jgi:hypothetical protein